MQIFDCTLRDGGNVVGFGFDKDLTESMIEGLIATGIKEIEYGHATGINSTKDDQSNCAALTDDEYLALAKPYTDKASLGLFVGWKNCTQEVCEKIKEAGLSFLRVGINASDGEEAKHVLKNVKDAGLECKIAMMKAYVLSPEDLAEEGKLLEESGADHLIIMDSAGYMMPDDVKAYVSALKHAVSCRVGFHGHNNLGLAQGNCVAAHCAGADTIDTGLLGMARSAGNISTEQTVAYLTRINNTDYDLQALLEYLDDELIPAMEKVGYHHFVRPEDLVLGLAGCHSSFVKDFKRVSQEENANLYQLIIETSKLNQKDPTVDLMKQVANTLED